MKKTLSINIAGFVFHIEEDAFATLDAYLKSIHAYFASFEGSKEIIADIESSIAEKFWNTCIPRRKFYFKIFINY